MSNPTDLEQLLKQFGDKHLTPEYSTVNSYFASLATVLTSRYSDGSALRSALRHLLCARDAVVRHAAYNDTQRRGARSDNERAPRTEAPPAPPSSPSSAPAAPWQELLRGLGDALRDAQRRAD